MSVSICRKFLVAALLAFFCLFAVALAQDDSNTVSSTSVVSGTSVVAVTPVAVTAGGTTLLTTDNDDNSGLYNANNIVFLLETSAAGSLTPFKFFF